MTTVDHKIEKLSDRMKRIEEKIDLMMRHLNIEMPEKDNTNIHPKPVDIKLRE